MREEVKVNWDWADSYLSEVEQILRENINLLVSIKVAPMEDDTQRATDMIIDIEGEGQVAVRLRRLKFRDFTIRSKAGGRTEIDKIRDGFARWYVYGWIENNMIDEWILVDLDQVRKENLLDNRRTINNKDGITGFISISIKELREKNCILSEKTRRLPNG